MSAPAITTFGTAALELPIEDLALNTADAARFLGLAPKTLVNYRSLGAGPAYLKYSGKRIAYLREDLIAFRDAHRVATASA